MKVTMEYSLFTAQNVAANAAALKAFKRLFAKSERANDKSRTQERRVDKDCRRSYEKGFC